MAFGSASGRHVRVGALVLLLSCRLIAPFRRVKGETHGILLSRGSAKRHLIPIAECHANVDPGVALVDKDAIGRAIVEDPRI